MARWLLRGVMCGTGGARIKQKLICFRHAAQFSRVAPVSYEGYGCYSF